MYGLSRLPQPLPIDELRLWTVCTAARLGGRLFFFFSFSFMSSPATSQAIKLHVASRSDFFFYSPSSPVGGCVCVPAPPSLSLFNGLVSELRFVLSVKARAPLPPSSLFRCCHCSLSRSSFLWPAVRFSCVMS